MQSDKIKELLDQIDSLNEELSSFENVLSEINSIRKKKNALNSKLRKLVSNTLENHQEAHLTSSKNNEYIISKELTKKIDVKRMKKDGVYEKYALPVESVKIKEKQSTLHKWI